jgi:hypothetical protein
LARQQWLAALELPLAQRQPDERQRARMEQQQVPQALAVQPWVAPPQPIATVSISPQQPWSSLLQPQLPAPPSLENVSAPTQRENYRSSLSASSFR